ncbi:MAG TPA: hypothetical protein VGK32_18090 [Vicinamibacterales bacterium]|jgi:Tfp pilus assembly protein PilX
MGTTNQPTDRRSEDGVALLSVILVLMLTSALLVGFVALVMSDQRSQFSNRDQTLAYGAAHAGLEQLTSKLGELFAANFRPTSTQVLALANAAPDLRDTYGNPYVTFTLPGNTPVANDVSGYRIVFTSVGGYPQTETTPRPIGSGPYQGLQGIATPYTIEVTARTTSGAEVRMRRTMQTMLIPAFQFGVFSEGPLAFHAGSAFNFGGRVHTNSNLFIAEGDGATLTVSDKVTAVGEVIRARLPNGVLTSVQHRGAVNIPNATKVLGMTEGSVVDGVGSAQNEPAWTGAVARLNRMIINGRTGARRLDLPLVQMGARPIDLIRRPPLTEATTNVVYTQRYFSRASLRILLSDFAEDLSNLPGVTAAAPVNLELFRTGTTPAWYPIPGRAPAATVPATYYNSVTSTWVPLTADYAADSTGYYDVAGTPLLRGYIKIEKQNTAGVWSDVTQEILTLGFTGKRLTATASFQSVGAASPCANVDTNAILRLQRVKDDHRTAVPGAEFGAAGTPATPCGMLTAAAGTNPAGTPIAVGDDYWPNALYDAREGTFRDSDQRAEMRVFRGGVMHYIELDVANLAKWFAGTIGTTGSTAENSDGGYVVYISDRRTNKLRPLVPTIAEETGEYGFEDNVNPLNATGYPGNGTLDTGEDVNGNGVLDIYGQDPYAYASPTLLRAGRTSPPVTTGTRPWDLASAREARSNAPLFFRRAVKLVDGADATGSTLRFLPAGTGLSIVAENPVYVEGNYNTGTGWTTTHRPSAVIADAVTLLSANWTDAKSFASPHNIAGRTGTTSWFRTAIVSGKTLFFPKQAWGSNDAGSDGGMHNYLRYLEDLGGTTMNYLGSMVSFYYGRQAVGIFKYGSNNPVYGVPTRSYAFDTEFLTFSLLPPKPPSFRDVNTLTFRQILRATQ